jgi:tRNA (cmo5U34)-methyltransferase
MGKQSPSDTLFRSTVNDDFQFTSDVAEVFDDMLSRSIPFYQPAIELVAALFSRLLDSRATVYDLGCSTGSTLISLAQLLEEKELQFIGIDKAPAMLDKARAKAHRHSFCRNIRFLEGDITHFQLEQPNAIICNYTLQFLRPPQRPAFLQNLYEALPTGGVLILSEKTISHHSRVNRAFINIYHEFKRSHGYSEMEIATKREALENILVPYSSEENLSLLREAGFNRTEPFFRWCNFVSFIALK